MVGARNIRPARDRIERRAVFANSEVLGIFIRWFSGRAAYNEYSAPQYSRNTKFSGFDMSLFDSFMNRRARDAPRGRLCQSTVLVCQERTITMQQGEEKKGKMRCFVSSYVFCSRMSL